MDFVNNLSFVQGQQNIFFFQISQNFHQSIWIFARLRQSDMLHDYCSDKKESESKQMVTAHVHKQLHFSSQLDKYSSSDYHTNTNTVSSISMGWKMYKINELYILAVSVTLTDLVVGVLNHGCYPFALVQGIWNVGSGPLTTTSHIFTCWVICNSTNSHQWTECKTPCSEGGCVGGHQRSTWIRSTHYLTSE